MTAEQKLPQTDWQTVGVPGARALQGTAVSSNAWRFPADLGNVVPAECKEVQSAASWLCVGCWLHNGK